MPTRTLIFGGAYLLACLAGIIASLHCIRKWWRIPAAHRAFLLRQSSLTTWTFPAAGLLLATIFCSFWIAHHLASYFSSPSVQLVTRIFIVHGTGLAAIAFYRRCRPEATANRRLRSEKILLALRQAPIFYIATLPFVTATALFSQFILNLFGQPPALQEAAAALLAADRPARFWLIGAACITAPIFEEMIFRGILFPLLAQVGGVPAAAITTAVCFAGMHMHAATVLPLFVLAIFLTAAYIYTHSLWTAIFMHALFNAVNIVLLLNCYPP